MREVQRYFNLSPNGPLSVVIEVMYHNFWGEKGMKARNFRYGCWSRNCPSYRGEPILNFDEFGLKHNPPIKDLLEKTFPEKSEAEK